MKAAAAALTILLTTTACSASNTTHSTAIPCAAENQQNCAATEDDLLDVTLAALHPTQPSLGYDEVFYRLGRYTIGADAGKQLFDAWCAANGQKGLKSANPGATVADRASFTCSVPVGAETPETIEPMKTGVIGPGGQVYLTDGHHTLTSFWEAPGAGPDSHIRLRITGNLSNLEPDAFWREMVSRGWTWLRDAEGNSVAPESLPKNLGLKQFVDDQYRGVLYFVRDIGYAQDENSPAFQEFYWGQWLRTQTDPSLRPANFNRTELASYLTLVDNIGKSMVAMPGDAEVADGRDANTLGKLNAFGEKAFKELSEPLSARKPGKLAISIEYRTTH